MFSLFLLNGKDRKGQLSLQSNKEWVQVHFHSYNKHSYTIVLLEFIKVIILLLLCIFLAFLLFILLEILSSFCTISPIHPYAIHLLCLAGIDAQVVQFTPGDKVGDDLPILQIIPSAMAVSLENLCS